MAKHDDKMPPGTLKGLDVNQDLKTTVMKEVANSGFMTTDDKGGAVFFGMPIDPTMKGLFDQIFTQAIPYVAEYVDKHGAKALSEMATQLGVAKGAEAYKFGKEYSKYLAYGTVLAQPIISTASTLADAGGKVNELRVALTPISKSNHSFATMDALFNASHNEVIANARTKIYNSAYARIVGAVANSVVSLPAIFSVWNSRSSRAKQMEQEVDLQHAMQDPEARKRYLEKYVSGKGSIRNTLEVEKAAEVKRLRTEYEAEFKTFKESSKGKTALEDIKKRVAEDIDFAREAGLSALHEATKGHAAKAQRSQRYQEERKLKDHSSVNKALEDQLRFHFAEEVKGQAFDKKWVRNTRVNYGSYYKSEKEKGPSTIVEGIDHIYNEIQKEFVSTQKKTEEELKGHKGGEGETVMNGVKLAVSALGGTMLERWLVGDMKKHLDKPVALDLILNMRKHLEASKEATSVPNYGHKSGDSSFTKYIHEIFQQHQEDCKKALIGDRYFNHLQAAKFDDEAIFKMKDEELSGYELAIKHIAHAIKDGNMDSIALINLVGQRKIVQNDAKTFGPKGTNGKPSAIIEEIEKQCACVASHQKISEEELSAVLGNLVLTEADIKHGFAGGAFKDEMRTLMFTLLESQVKDHAALEKLTGLSKADIEAMHKQGQQHFDKYFDQAILGIASMSNEEMGDLAKHDITVEEIKLIRKAAQDIKEHKESAAEMLTGKEKTVLEQAVLNVLAAEEKDGKNFWQERVRNKGEAKDAIKEVLAQGDPKERMKARASDAIKEAIEQEVPTSATAQLAAKRSHKHDKGAETPLGLGI